MLIMEEQILFFSVPQTAYAALRTSEAFRPGQVTLSGVMSYVGRYTLENPACLDSSCPALMT